MNPENAILSQIIMYPDLYFKLELKEILFLNQQNKKIFITIKNLINKNVTQELLSIS